MADPNESLIYLLYPHESITKGVNSVPYQLVPSEYTVLASNQVHITPLFHTGKNTGHTGQFKLPTYGLKSYDASVLLDFFFFLISFDHVFLSFLVFLEERDIKVEQNYIFSRVFNRDRL